MNDELVEMPGPVVVATIEATHQVVDEAGKAVSGVPAAIEVAQHLNTGGNGPAWIENAVEPAQVPTEVKK